MVNPYFTYGKYAGIPIKDYTEGQLYWLRWVRNDPAHWAKLNREMKQAINLRLDGKA